MTTIIALMACTLGIIVPVLMIISLARGIKKTPFADSQKLKWKQRIMWATIFWALVLWLLSITGVFSYHDGDIVPRFAIALLIPVIMGLILLRVTDFKTILNSTPLIWLVGMQSFRLMGVLFLFAAWEGLGHTGCACRIALPYLYNSSPLIKNSKTSIQ